MKIEASDHIVQFEILGSNVFYAEGRILRFSGRRLIITVFGLFG